MKLLTKYKWVTLMLVSFLVSSCEKHETAIDYTLKVGNIYIEDGRILPPSVYDPDLHTAVAVITYVGQESDGFKALAIALDEWTDCAATMNCELSGVSGEIDDMSGRSNTAAMLAAMDDTEDLECPAATSVNRYREADGRWHLPACGELLKLADNRQKVDESLSIIGGQPLSTDLYLSSTVDGTDENSKIYFMRNVSLHEGRVVSGSKTAPKIVRPFLLIH